MPAGAVHGVDGSGAAVQDLARRTRASAAALGRDVWRRVTATVPGADGWEEALVAAGPSSAEANLRVLAAVLEADGDAGRGPAPVLALRPRPAVRPHADAARGAAQRLPGGHELWRGFYVEVLQEHARTPAELARSAHLVSAATFAYLPTVTAQVTEARRSGAAVRLGLDVRARHTALVARPAF